MKQFPANGNRTSTFDITCPAHGCRSEVWDVFVFPSSSRRPPLPASSPSPRLFPRHFSSSIVPPLLFLSSSSILVLLTSSSSLLFRSSFFSSRSMPVPPDVLPASLPLSCHYRLPHLSPLHRSRRPCDIIVRGWERSIRILIGLIIPSSQSSPY